MRPLTREDILRVRQVSARQIAPDGHRVADAVDWCDVGANAARSPVWIDGRRLLPIFGMFLRMLAADDPERTRAEGFFDQHLSELETAWPNYPSIPVRKLVAVQLASALHMARFLQHQG